MNLKYRPKSPI